MLIKLAALAALFWWTLFFRVWRGRRFILSLRLFRGQVPLRYPALSVVVPACNEASTVEQALQSLLELDYPDYEVVVVNDRSSDETGRLLDRLATGHERVRVLHLDGLPEGWLGKTHALQVGASEARGELILFTDADVVFESQSLRWAVNAMEQLEVDHLVVGPRILTSGFWEQIFIGYFGLAFVSRYPPERVSSSNPKDAIGVGAFNLVRHQVYEAVGGHRPIAFQVADDLCLGQLIKGQGFRQGFLETEGEVRVRWVCGLKGIVRGLEKNGYAGLHYSMAETLVATSLCLLSSVAPLAALLSGDPVWALAGFSAMLACSITTAPAMGAPRWAGLFFPLAGTIFAFVLLRSAWLAELRRGIYWRGTFYPLEQLRARDRLDS